MRATSGGRRRCTPTLAASAAGQRFQKSRSPERDLNLVSSRWRALFDTKEGGYLDEHVVDRGGGRGGTVCRPWIGSAGKDGWEATPEPWRNAALAVMTYLADNPLAECHCPDCLRLFVEEARTDVPAGLGCGLCYLEQPIRPAKSR